MNAYARQVLGPAMSDFGRTVFHYHSRKSHSRIEALLQESQTDHPDMPAAMIIDVLNKVLMINVSRIETEKSSADPLFAMTFIDVTEHTGAEINPHTGLVEMKKFPVYNKKSEIMFLDVSSIYFIQSDGNYCVVFTENSSYYLHLTLKNVLQRYTGPRFFRVHKSFIVNTDHIYKIKLDNKGHPVIVFDRKDITAVPVARRRFSELKKIFTPSLSR
jgi:DNA-binding LytR/AlgR family response regulator